MSVFSQSTPTPNFRRMMVFVDGENLAIRYGAMLKAGREPLADVFYQPGVLAWGVGCVGLGLHEVVRATYYTSVTGTHDAVDEVVDRIQGLRFNGQPHPRMNNTLNAVVFKKEGRSKGKGVDIRMTVDILSHAIRGNTDAIYLVSGDGDFVPVVEEVRRAGVEVYVAALSSGISSQLRRAADVFVDLDGRMFRTE